MGGLLLALEVLLLDLEVHALGLGFVVELLLLEVVGMGLLAETSARMGMTALGAGLGMERYESIKMSS